MVQSIRDVRQTGRISKGEQEYMEQIGINVGKMEVMMQKYVQDERSDDAPWDTRKLFDFVEHVTNELVEKAQVDKIRMDMLGLEEKVNSNNTFKEKVATNLLSKE